MKRMLKSENHRARAAATRVLSYWHPRIEGSTELLNTMFSDDSAMVRAEAVRAASFFPADDVAEGILDVMGMEVDTQMEYLMDETMKVIDGE
jgi:hypothetical protein